jgi:hypothetical protein
MNLAVLRAVLLLALLATVPSLAQEQKGKAPPSVTVKATDDKVTMDTRVAKGDWIELQVTGQWRMWDQWDYTGPQGHPRFKKINALGYLGALVCQIGDAPPFTLPDLLPFQAPAAGTLAFWPNRAEYKALKADGQLTIVVQTGAHLKEKRDRLVKEKKEALERLLQDKEIGKALALLNEARKNCGLEPVRLSVELSAGCARHAKYLVLNKDHPLTEGLKAHEEHKQLKGYSPEGAKAGKAANISFISPSQGMADCLAGFYHRIPLLQPTLTAVGIGYDKAKHEWVTVVDCGTETVGERTRDIVYFPEDGQENVPLRSGLEFPSPVPESHAGPTGFPITVYFAAEQKVKKITVTLTNAANKAVAAFVSTPEAPASGWIQWNTVCIIPKQPLVSRTTYTVMIQGEVDGKAFSRRWQFTTGKGE